jgi:hypothetical protein
MTKLKLDEISVVDYPAHLVNGFAVVKSATDQDSSAILDALSKRNTETMTTDLTKAVAEASIEDLQKALEERTDVADVVKAFAPKVDPKDAVEPDKDDITKGLDPKVAEIFKAQAAQIEEFRKAAEKSATDAAVEKSLRLDREAIEKAKEAYTNLAYDHDTVDPLIRKFVEANPEAGEALETMLKAVNEQADGAIFKELGTKAAPSTDSDPLENIAKALVADGKAANYADAIAKAVADPANKSLVSAHFEAGSN